EDDGGVGAPPVLLEEIDDRAPAGLLFAVAGEAHVHGQGAGGGQVAGGAQEHVQLSLVVGDTARVEVLVSDRGIERRRLPELERVLGLNVEVAVAQYGGRRVRVARRAHFTDGQRLAVPVDQVGVAA